MGYPVKLTKSFRYEGQEYQEGDTFYSPTEYLQTFMIANGTGQAAAAPAVKKTRRRGKYGTRKMSAGGPEPELDSREMTVEESHEGP